MGLDLGLESQGFEPAVICELDSASVATIRRNRPNLPVVAADITSIGRRELEAEAGISLKGIDLVVGGPPCQAFSVMGRRRGIEDERGSLTFDFVRIVEELRPRAFLMENVRGLLSMPLAPKGSAIPDADPRRAHGGLFNLVLEDFNRLGYRVQVFVVNSANYGAPQVRERMLIIGNRFDWDVDFPAPQFSNLPEDGLPPFATLRDAIGPGFEDPDPTLMNFSARKLHYLSMVPPGGNWRSLPEELQQEAMGKQYFLKGGRSSSWRRLSWDFPSPTVHTLPNHATTSMCHPGELRALTVGECAAIQEFPSDWEFCGTPSEKYRQIGNAVPVRLGAVAGGVLRELLDGLDAAKARAKKPSKAATVQHLRPHVRVRTWYHRDHGAFAGDVEYGAHKKRPSQQPTLFDDLSDFDEAEIA
jgi:DNA (cytosine-5)-methyltransferase 1